MRKVLIAVALALNTSAAFADCAGSLTGGFGFTSAQATRLCDAMGEGIFETIVLPAGENLRLSNTGFVQLAPYVPTFAATPVAGTNDFRGGLNVVPPTPTANAAAFLPANPTPGTQVIVYNAGAATVRAKAGSGDTINGGTQDGYIAVATKARLVCDAESSSNWNCALGTVPTPGGP